MSRDFADLGGKTGKYLKEYRPDLGLLEGFLRHL